MGAAGISAERSVAPIAATTPRAPRLVDMHCHLDLMADGTRVAHDAAARGIAILDATVTPGDFAASPANPAPLTRRAVGLHPWWLADGRCTEADVDLLASLAASARYVGEVGLDFSARYAASRDDQVLAFTRLADACAAHPVPGRVLTIHAVRSAATVLDILERTGLIASATCILHWFSGTSDELVRARKLGCCISVNEHMLATRKGREYARVVPERLLLLETDAPPGSNTPYTARDLEVSLERTLSRVAELRRCDTDELGARIAAHSAALLDL